MKVDVYRNLQKGCLSIRSREPDEYGRVIDHTDEAYIEDVSFVVQPAGLARCIETGTKNVHAVVRGRLCDSFDVSDSDHVTYNPYKHTAFYAPDIDRYVGSAERCRVSADGIEALL